LSSISSANLPISSDKKDIKSEPDYGEIKHVPSSDSRDEIYGEIVLPPMKDHSIYGDIKFPQISPTLLEQPIYDQIRTNIPKLSSSQDINSATSYNL